MKRVRGNSPTEIAGASFSPKFVITPAIARGLMRIEAVRQHVEMLPITPRVLANLRETSRLFSTHYSTMIEGNRLTQEQVAQVVADDRHFPGRERDQDEVKGYYAALDELERSLRHKPGSAEKISAETIQRLHALVMGGGRTRVRPTQWCDGQNVIRDGRSNRIVYMPPEARDVAPLMGQFLNWINRQDEIPAPIGAAIAHYQFATIHPYYDGNGRTARLLTTLALHLGGYGLKGIYALEEYYARDLGAYYAALTVGPSHNYYLGRADADITPWIAYFIAGMADSFEKVRDQAVREGARGGTDQAKLLRELDGRQRRVLALFRKSNELAAKDVARVFGYQPRTTALLCQRWVAQGFMVTADPARKTRRYRLGEAYSGFVD